MAQGNSRRTVVKRTSLAESGGPSETEKLKKYVNRFNKLNQEWICGEDVQRQNLPSSSRVNILRP
jgi:hypothetical protein